MEPTLLTRKNKKSGIVTKSLYFRTLAMSCLNYYHELFYKEGVKIIPSVQATIGIIDSSGFSLLNHG